MKKLIAIILILMLVCSCTKKQAPSEPTIPSDAPSADGVKEYPFTYQTVRLFTTERVSGDIEDGLTVVYNTDDLDAYGKGRIDKEFDTLEYDKGQPSFFQLTKKYDSEFFSDNQLLICTITAPSTSYRYEVTRLTDDAVYINEIAPESADTAVEKWAIMVEAPRFDSSATDIYINDENYTGTPATVTVGAGVTSLSVHLPDGWDYEKVEHLSEENEYGIRFFPEGCEGGLYLMYQPSLGVCGTFLETNKKTYAGYECSVMTWDGKPDWDIIAFPTDHGAVCVCNENAAWLSDREKEVEKILNSIEIKGSTLSLNEAKQYAAAEYNADYDGEPSSGYNLNDDTFLITFRRHGSEFAFRVYPKGKVKPEKLP